MRILICDDELPILREISEKIRRYMPGETIVSVSSGEELLHELRRYSCDILFLDIDLPDMDGMDIAKELGHMEDKPLLIFVTSHDELVYESLQYHPFGFIRKSFFDENIERMLRDCRKELGARRKRFTFRSGDGDVALPLSDILYFEAEGNYLVIHTTGRTFRFRSTLTAVLERLGDCGFIRAHKGFLVNREAVRLIGKGELELTGGDRIPLGRNYAEEAKEQLLQLMRM